MPTKSKLVYLPPAQHDFEEIVKYHITEAGTPYARKIYSTMKTTINRLRDFPLMGQTHPDPILAASGYRKLVLTKTYVAIYKLLTMQSQSPSRFTVRMLRFTGVRTRNAREKPVQRPTSFRLMKKTVGSSTFGALSSRRTSLSPLQNRSKSHSPLTLRAMSKSLHSMLSMQ